MCASENVVLVVKYYFQRTCNNSHVQLPVYIPHTKQKVSKLKF